MLTYFCPHCWAIITEEQQICQNCGFVLDEFNKNDYEDKLIASLNHAVPERRIMAAQILGIRKSQRALIEFKKIVESDETNYFFLRAILLATAKIDQPDRLNILHKATQNPSTLVSDLARQLLLDLSQNKDFDEWDHNTG